MQANLGHFELQILSFCSYHYKLFWAFLISFYISYSLIYLYIYIHLSLTVCNFSYFYIALVPGAKAKQTFTPSFSITTTELSHLIGFPPPPFFSLLFYLSDSSLQFCWKTKETFVDLFFLAVQLHHLLKQFPSHTFKIFLN